MTTYAAGCSEDVSDGVADSEKSDVEGFAYLASDGGDQARRGSNPQMGLYSLYFSVL